MKTLISAQQIYQRFCTFTIELVRVINTSNFGLIGLCKFHMALRPRHVAALFFFPPLLTGFPWLKRKKVFQSHFYANYNYFGAGFA